MGHWARAWAGPAPFGGPPHKNGKEGEDGSGKFLANSNRFKRKLANANTVKQMIANVQHIHTISNKFQQHPAKSNRIKHTPATSNNVKQIQANHNKNNIFQQNPATFSKTQQIRATSIASLSAERLAKANINSNGSAARGISILLCVCASRAPDDGRND